MTRSSLAALANRQWTPRAVAWAGGIFIVAILAMAAYDIVRGYVETTRNTMRELNSHARVIAEQTARTVQAIDVVLRHMARQFDEGALSGLSTEDLRALLKEQAVGLVQIDGLLLIGADGTVRASSYLPRAQDGKLNIAGLPTFEMLRSTRITDLYIGRVQVSRADSQWMFPITRRLESSPGVFAGGVGARGRIAYFQEFYRNARLDEGTTVALTYEDGTLMARHPSAESALGKPIRLSETTTAALKAKQPIMTRAVSPLDGSDRFVVLQPVPGYPLAVFVTREADIALGPWKSQALGTATRTLALGALAALLIAIVMRQLSRVNAARASLETSQERFSVAVAGSDDGIWDWDYSTGRAFGSQRAREILGLPPGFDMQSIEQWFAAIDRQLHPDDAPRRLEAIRAHLAGETPTYEGEYRVRNPDGSYRWVRIRGLCVRRGTGKPHRMAGSIADIDAGKRAEEGLRKSQERFALAVAGSGDGIWDFDFTTQRVFSSARTRELLGLPPGPEVQTAEEWFGIVKLHPEDTPKRDAAMQAHVAGSTPAYDVEFRVLHPDGSYRWVHAHGLCVRDAAGNPYRMAGSVTDIDARRRAEEALRESEERFALAVAGSNDGIWDFDFVRGRVFNSARGRTMIGMPPYPESEPLEDWLAKLPTYLHPDDVERRNAALQAHLEGRTATYEVEVRYRQPDGTYRWQRIRGISVRGPDGKPLRMAGSASDIDAQKRAEQALRESEERFALAVEGSNDGILDWDIVNDRMYSSSRAMQIVGIESDVETRSRTEWVAALHFHPEDEALHAEDMKAFLEGTETTRESEYRLRRPSGEYSWVRARYLCVRDASGRAIRLAGSVSDIDPYKRAEAALRESEERFALAVAGSNDGIVDWDIPNDRMYMSPRALEIVGITSDVNVRTRIEWRDLLKYHPEDAPRVRDEVVAFLAGSAETREAEYRVQLPNGDYRWIRHRNKVIRNAQGEPVRLSGSVSDIDARKKAEAGLRESEERYQLAVDGANQGLWDWDMRTDAVFLSPRAQHFLGLQPNDRPRSREEWLAQSAIHPDDKERARGALSDHLHGRTPFLSVEYRVRHGSGQWHWYRQRGVISRDAKGRPYRMAGSVEDITAYKQAEAHRAQLEGQLLQAKKLEAIGTLAGGIAHDFNNILAAILGYGEMAQKNAAAGTALRRHVDAVVSAGMRAKSLVERILAFSRSGVGERVPVHVQSVVNEALDLVAASLPQHVRLERNLDAASAAVVGDPTQIHQVVMNLCANAAQAMKSTGALTVSLDAVEKSGSMAATSALASGRYVRLSVRDTGTGIPANVLERIFDPFFTTKEVGVGTGLGLSLVHGIVTDLGGGIDVDSRAGEGTTFTVYLPWSSAAAAPATVEESVPGGAGETILLVDDEEVLVHLGEEMIAMLGYEPVGFTSSNAALAAFRAAPERFNAVLSDESMPEMTGSELARAIRSIRADLPIVLMSGVVSPALSARARDIGVVEVIAKPLVSRDIARTLATALHPDN